VKERKGPFGQMVGGIVDTVVQGARRRAQDREPRVLLYDEHGHPQLVPHDAPAREAMITAAGELIDLVGGAPPEAEAETETETETEVTAEDAAAVSAVEADPDEVDDTEVVTDAEIVETDDDIATADDEVATADDVVDADVAPEPDDDRP
jgi:hypothetical protein